MKNTLRFSALQGWLSDSNSFSRRKPSDFVPIKLKTLRIKTVLDVSMATLSEALNSEFLQLPTIFYFWRQLFQKCRQFTRCLTFQFSLVGYISKLILQFVVVTDKVISQNHKAQKKDIIKLKSVILNSLGCGWWRNQSSAK